MGGWSSILTPYSWGGCLVSYPKFSNALVLIKISHWSLSKDIYFACLFMSMWYSLFKYSQNSQAVLFRIIFAQIPATFNKTIVSPAATELRKGDHGGFKWVLLCSFFNLRHTMWAKCDYNCNESEGLLTQPLLLYASLETALFALKRKHPLLHIATERKINNNRKYNP